MSARFKPSKALKIIKRFKAMKVLIVHYSLFGHTHFLAAAIEKGAAEVEGAFVEMKRVSETLS